MQNYPQEELLFDRSQQDKTRAKELKNKALLSGWSSLSEAEKAEWMSGLRGGLNDSDLNRIEKWSKYLSDELNKRGYGVPFSGRVGEWKDGDEFYLEDINRIRGNVIALKDWFFRFPEWREILLDDTMTMDQLNAIEWDMQKCVEWVDRMDLTYPHSGMYSSGAVPYIISI